MSAVTVNREDLLRRLETVSPGLSTRDIIEQSSCFVFRGGKVLTFNDEVACSAPSGLDPGLVGAVPAKPLKEILSLLKEETLEVSGGDGHLVVRGKAKVTKVVLEKEVLLPVAEVEKPKKWAPLHDEFLAALGMVQACAGNDPTELTVFVHLHPDWLEATDNFQACRYRLKTGVAAPVLVRKESVRHAAVLGVTEMALTDTWLHFRGAEGLVLSVRRFMDDYKSEELTQSFLVEGGAPVVFPKGLVEAAARAAVFSEQSGLDESRVFVRLSPGKVRVRGEGVHGHHSETRNAAYRGPRLEFLIDPKLLAEIVQKYNECLVTPEVLKVAGPRWEYVAALVSPEAALED